MFSVKKRKWKKDSEEEDGEVKIDANNTIPKSDSSDSSSDEEESENMFLKHLNEAQEDNLQVQEVEGDWECFECGSHFIGESDMHYMKHASEEV